MQMVKRDSSPTEPANRVASKEGMHLPTNRSRRERTGYDQFNKSISADGYSAQVQLRMTVNIRYDNNKTNEHWERQFQATTQYNSTQQLTSVRLFNALSS